MQLDRKTLAFLQLPSSKGDLYAPTSGSKGLVHHIVLHNTNTTAEAVVLNYHNGTNEYEIFSQSIAAGATLIWDFKGAGDIVEDGGKYTGNTTTASKVTVKVMGTEETPGSGQTLIAGALSNLWVPPATPNVADDEFENSSFSTWSAREMDTPAAATISEGTVDAYDTAFTSGTVVRVNVNPAERPSWALIQPPARSPIKRFHLYKSYTYPTNVLIWARMKFSIRQAGSLAEDAYAGIGIHQANAGNPEFANCILMYLNETEAGETKAEYRYYNSGGTGLGLIESTDTDVQGQALEYIAIHKIGTDYHGWVGTASGNWIWMGVFGSGDLSFSPDQIAISVSNVDGSNPGPHIVGIDFLRFVETVNFLL